MFQRSEGVDNEAFVSIDHRTEQRKKGQSEEMKVRQRCKVHFKAYVPPVSIGKISKRAVRKFFHINSMTLGGVMVVPLFESPFFRATKDNKIL